MSSSLWLRCGGSKSRTLYLLNVLNIGREVDAMVVHELSGCLPLEVVAVVVQVVLNKKIQTF